MSTDDDFEMPEQLCRNADLYNADPDCDGVVTAQWSGVRCSKCRGWFCW